MRTIKTVVGGERYLYYYSGDKLISMTWDDGGRSLNFLYNGASPYSVVYYDGTYSTSYYYITNLQGDVVAIMNAQHAVVARYVYDAWGNILAITDSNGSDISGNAAHIANLNPIRYRGYFYDTETGFYYLQSRYYDPVIGRFINLDGFVTTGQGFLSYNMYAYCRNNPVVRADYNGEFSLGNLWNKGKKATKAVCDFVKDKIVKPVVSRVSSLRTTETIKSVDCGAGSIEVSATLRTPEGSPGYINSYVDAKNDGTQKIGVESDFFNMYGVDTGIDTSGYIYHGNQFGSFFHSEIAVGKEGVSSTIGIDIGNTSYDVSVNVKWWTIGWAMYYGYGFSPTPAFGY